MKQGRAVGRAMFATVLLMIGGVLNVIYGIAAIGNSSFFTHSAHYVFANLKAWGWITLILGVLELLASLSLIRGGQFGRWFGIGVGVIVAIGALLDIPAYPLWSLAMFAISIWIVAGLAIFQEPQGPIDYGESEGFGLDVALPHGAVPPKPPA